MFSKLLPPIINLTNSVIGAALMSIPFSYSECGIILTSMIIILISFITVLASEFLIKVSGSQNKYSYEELCLLSYGGVGKAILDVNMIGMMYGSLIAYVIILGDLGTELLHEQLQIQSNWVVRTAVLMLSLIVILPLCLKRNIDNLANASAVSLLFYIILTFHLIVMSSDNLPPKAPVEELRWWRSYGLMTVIPIISLGLTLQTQVFAVFNSIPDGTQKEMILVIRISTLFVCVCYCLVGTFGYMKFSQYKPTISADLLSMYPASFVSTFMKCGFLASVAISYPLTAFPVRTSIYSLLYLKPTTNKGESPMAAESHIISQKDFDRITFGIIISSFIIGLVMNNIEVVLSLTGSFSGSIVLFIFPALIFIKNKPLSKFRHVANLILVFGIAILALSFLNSINTQRFLMGGKINISYLNLSSNAKFNISFMNTTEVPVQIKLNQSKNHKRNS